MKTDWEISLRSHGEAEAVEAHSSEPLSSVEHGTRSPWCMMGAGCGFEARGKDFSSICFCLLYKYARPENLQIFP